MQRHTQNCCTVGVSCSSPGDLSKASSAPADAPTAAEATPAPHALPTTTDTATSSSTTSITSQDSSPTDADSTSAVISTIITAIDATSGDNNQAVLEEQLSNAVKPAAAAAAAAGPSKLAVPQPGPAAGAVAGGDKLPEGAAAPLPPAANPQTSSDSLADTGRDNTKSSSDKTATADAASDSPIPTAAGAAGDRAGMSSPPATSLDITPGPEPAAAPPADTSVELSHGQAPAAAAADSSKAADLTTADTDTSSGPDGSTTTQHYGISDKAGSSTPTGTDHATTGTQAGSGAGSSATGTPDSDVNATLTTSTSSSSRAIDNFSQGAAEGPAGGSVITTLGNAFKPPTGGLPAAANVSGDSNDSSLGQPPATTGTSREAQGGPTVAPMMSPADRHDDSSRAVDRAAGSGEAGSGSIRETAPLPMAQPDSNLQTSSTSHTHIYTRDTSSSSSRAMEGVQPSEQPAVTAGQPGPSGVDKESDLAAESSSSSRGISSSSTKPSSDQPQQPEARASSAAAEGKDTDTTAQLQPLSEAPQAREAPKAPQVDISTDSKTPEGSSSSITTTAPTTTSDLAPAAASELQAPQPTPAPPAPPPYDAEVSEEAAATIAAIAAAASGVKPFPPELLPAVGTSPDLTSKHLEVLSVWYTKLCFDTEAQQQAALKQHCDPHMEFEDNFIKVGLCACGVGGAFRLLIGADFVAYGPSARRPTPTSLADVTSQTWQSLWNCMTACMC